VKRRRAAQDAGRRGDFLPAPRADAWPSSRAGLALVVKVLPTIEDDLMPDDVGNRDTMVVITAADTTLVITAADRLRSAPRSLAA
jgi:hypothetical protein